MKILKETVENNQRHIYYTKDGVSISHKVIEPIQPYIQAPPPTTDNSMTGRISEVEKTLNYILLGGI